MGLMKKMSGYKVEYMPDLSFRLMSLVFIIRDLLFPVGKRLDRFGLQKGSVVVDFGCGPGSYVKPASQRVGKTGKVYAVDVHPLAIRSVKQKLLKENLDNVVPVLSTGYPVDIASRSADIIYALDMFHHVIDTGKFLSELNRLLKPQGALFIERGHQSLDDARHKILRSGCWMIVEDDGNLFKCTPTSKNNPPQEA